MVDLIVQVYPTKCHLSNRVLDKHPQTRSAKVQCYEREESVKRSGKEKAPRYSRRAVALEVTGVPSNHHRLNHRGMFRTFRLQRSLRCPLFIELT